VTTWTVSVDLSLDMVLSLVLQSERLGLSGRNGG
jgi:hypothetical protein